MSKLIKVGQNWNCPYCGHDQVISRERFHHKFEVINVSGWKEGFPGYIIASVICANNQCKEMSANFSMVKRSEYEGGEYKILGHFKEWRLLPSSFAKPQPDFIPEPLKDDYEEACAIRDLSPKASATLIRRCIQGIIRDFCGISKKRLVDEIDALKDLVEDGKAPSGVQADTVQAIDDVRKIGNIGAHMEADINVIVDVDPDEAQTLIELTEMLFDEWYVERDKRTKKIAKIGAISSAKKAAQKQS